MIRVETLARQAWKLKEQGYLTFEAEAVLNHLKRVTGQPASQLISWLLDETDEINRSD